VRLHRSPAGPRYILLGDQRIKTSAEIVLVPPPAGLKNDVLRLRSVNSIVIAPASTGKDRRRIIVNKSDQTNSGTRSSSIPAERILRIVVIKLIAPMIEDAFAR